MIKTIILLIVLCVLSANSLKLIEEVRLYPNTENSPSIYILPFTLDRDLPNQSYILVTMAWYTAAVSPFNCILVNTSILLNCTNFETPTFALTITTNNLLKFNDKMTTLKSKTMAILVNSNLAKGTNYYLQLHLHNAIPNIQKISNNIEIYTVSYDGLVYEYNPNFAAVINNVPNSNLMAVTILNDLSLNNPGSSSTIRAQVTISQPITTPLSSFMVIVHNPFSFSVGSIPTVFQSSQYTTFPTAINSRPTIASYQVVSPNIFTIVFNQKFVANRKFIIQINEIINPYKIASSNISLYSLNYNTHTPLQAFQMLYPIATNSYDLNMVMGLPNDAPKTGAMQFYYQRTHNMVQIKLTIPYSVPNGYSIRIVPTLAQFYFFGHAYCNIHSNVYTPVYSYGQYYIIVTKFGPLIAGTVVTCNFHLYIQTLSLFRVAAYIDTESLISTFVSTKYLYFSKAQDTAIQASGVYNNFFDTTFRQTERVASYDALVPSVEIILRFSQRISSTATSTGSYVDVYIASPYVEINPSFNAATNVRMYRYDHVIQWVYGLLTLTYVKTSTYLRLTIKGTTAALNTYGNLLFLYNTLVEIKIANLFYFPYSSTNRIVYPVYTAMYKADTVNPTTYYDMTMVSASPSTPLPGGNLYYINNYVSTTTFMTYPGLLRFQSTTPSLALQTIVVQPNQPLSLLVSSRPGFRGFSPLLANMATYPCASNIAVKCTYLIGWVNAANAIQLQDRVMVEFLNQDYRTKPFHIVFADTNIRVTRTYYYQLGFYNQLTKDWTFKYYDTFSRADSYWYNTPTNHTSTLTADITGKAGSYRSGVRITLANPGANLGQNFLILSTQWSFFQMNKSSLSASTSSMLTPAQFYTDNLAPLSVYMTNGLYLTVIPITYRAVNTNFNITLDNVHMPYTYDLPNFYLSVARNGDFLMSSSNQFVMTNGGTLYEGPLQNLLITCNDNAKGVVNTYCNIQFGTSNPLLAGGIIRIAFSGMTVSTDLCYLTLTNLTRFKVPCTTSSDNKNVTANMTGWQFYPSGNYTFTVYGIGLTSSALSQSIEFYLYDSSVQFVIETGVRILTTTIASLYYISLTEINYAYLNPLSYNTMSIKFYIPRLLYEDEEFAFVIGEDLSDVNTQTSRLNITITRSDNFVVKALYYIDNVNYLIIFSFINLAQFTIGDYTMTIYGICTPASQTNGAFNMIYRRKKDFTYTVVNSADVIFPTFNDLVTSSITLLSYYNTEGFKQDYEFTLTNTELNIDEDVVFIINFPTYYSSHLFQQNAYCMINQTPITCQYDPNTPYQLIIKDSPKTITYGTSYKITVYGLSCPRNIYMNNAYPNRFIFIGILEDQTSSSYSQRALLLPYQTITATAAAGIIQLVDMVNPSATYYAFSSLYAQLSLICSVNILTGSYLYLDFPEKFDNFNNIPLNVILQYGSTLVSTTATVKKNRVQILISIPIALKTSFILQFPNLPTPKFPGIVQMSHTIITVSVSTRLNTYAASQVEGNSAPKLTFISNSRYVSFNNDQTLLITAGTYSSYLDIDSSDNNKFISNVNIKLSSTGLVFEPETVFIAMGKLKESFRVGADQALVPVTYFYQGIKQEELFSNYQVTLNMNIRITNTPVSIVLPTTLTMPRGGCTNPFIIKLTNPPFIDVTITYIFDNSLYSEDNFYPNPQTTANQLTFNSTFDNNTFSFCSSSTLNATQIPISFYLSGTNFNSYSFSPSNVILVNIIASISNVTPTVTLTLKNQQKTFLDVNFTNNVDGNIYYQMMLGQNMTPLTLQKILVYLKANKYVIQKQADLLTKVYTTDRDNRLGQFFQVASQTTLRISNLIPQTFYTLCAYVVNGYLVSSQVTCLQLSTLTWGTIQKARVTFTTTLTAQQLNNVLCYFTSATSTNQYYLADIEGNSCGNRSVVNNFYKYLGTSFTTETSGTLIYLANNPFLTGTDPSPLAFTNLFGLSNALSVSALSTAQSQFSITYLSGTYLSSNNARLFASTTIASGLTVFFNTPTYDSTTKILTVSSVQLIGSVGTVYFVLVLYKQISRSSGNTFVNIRVNVPPTAEKVLNCQNWQGIMAAGCARAVYSGVQPLTVTFSNIQSDSLYMLYYMPASQYPFRPIVSGNVYAQTVVTFSSQKMNILISILLISIFAILL